MNPTHDEAQKTCPAILSESERISLATILLYESVLRLGEQDCTNFFSAARDRAVLLSIVIGVAPEVMTGPLYRQLSKARATLASGTT